MGVSSTQLDRSDTLESVDMPDAAAILVQINQLKIDVKSIERKMEAIVASVEEVGYMSYSDAGPALTEIKQLRIDFKGIDMKMGAVEKVLTAVDADNKGSKRIPDIQFDLNMPAEGLATEGITNAAERAEGITIAEGGIVGPSGGGESARNKSTPVWDDRLKSAFQKAVIDNGGYFTAKAAAIRDSMHADGCDDIHIKQVQSYLQRQRFNIRNK